MGVDGCFGPRKLKYQLYIQLISSMHHDTNRIVYSENMDIFSAVKQRMTKKGQLRKFVDNLSSHRNKILESLNFNYKLTIQTKEMERHCVGLIITDAIIEIIYPSNSNVYVPQREVYEQEPDYLVGSLSSSSQHSSPKKMEQMSSFHNIHYTALSPKKQYQFYQENKTLHDEQYFKLIYFLYENEKRVHSRLLQSLILFCQKHKGLINCDRYVTKLVQKAIQNIKRNIFLQQSCKVLSMILLRIRNQLVQQLRDGEALITVIKVWMREKQGIDGKGTELETNCYQIIQIYFNLCISSWDSLFLYEVVFRIFDMIEFQNNKVNVLQKMYQELLKNHDLKLHFFRGLFNYLLGYLSITAENLMGEVDKKWFTTSIGLNYQKMFLQYKNVLKDTVKIEAFKLLSRWINKKYTNINQSCIYNTKALIFVYIANAKYYYKNKATFQVLQDEYFKIINKLNKENRQLFKERIFEDLREEGLAPIEYELLLKIIKEMLCKEQHLYTALLHQHSNSHIYRSVDLQKTTAFKKIKAKHGMSTPKTHLPPLNPLKAPHSNHHPKARAQSTFSNPQTQQKQSLITIPKYQQLSQNFDLYITPILLIYQKQLKLEILKIIGYILQKIESIKLNEEGKLKLCQFFHSIYLNVKADNTNIHEKYEFVCAVMSVIRIMMMKSLNCSPLTTTMNTSYKSIDASDNGKCPVNCRFLLLAYVFKIQKEITEKYLQNSTVANIRSLHMNMSIQSEYLLLYLAYEIKNLLSNVKNSIDNYSSERNTEDGMRKSGIGVIGQINQNKNKGKNGQIGRMRQRMCRINRRMTILYSNRHDNSIQINDMSYYYDEGMNKYQSQLLKEIQEFVSYYEEQIKEINQPKPTSAREEGSQNQEKYAVNKQNAEDKQNKSKQLSQEQQQQYREYSSIFKKLFSTCQLSKSLINGMKTPRLSHKDSEPPFLFRKNSNLTGSMNEKNRESDKSFEEVLDIVHI